MIECVNNQFEKCSKMRKILSPFLNIANSLTLFRIACIPLILLGFYINISYVRAITTVIFLIACITDYLDGWVARNFNQTTRLGTMLDPIADKLLISAVLLMLVAFNRVSKFSVLAVLIILMREILVSGLREYLGSLQAYLKVDWLTKLKTFLQMAAMAWLMWLEPKPKLTLQISAESLLWISALLTLYTGWKYTVTAVTITATTQDE